MFSRRQRSAAGGEGSTAEESATAGRSQAAATATDGTPTEPAVQEEAGDGIKVGRRRRALSSELDSDFQVYCPPTVACVR